MKNSMRFSTITRALALLGGAALIAPGGASAYSSGITGYSGQQGRICTQCHSGGVAPTVTLTGPASVAAGSTSTYTLTLSGGQKIAGGLDVSASGGTLAAGSAGTMAYAGEITHTTPAMADAAGNVAWTFDWTAPAAAGTYTLYGASASVNSNGSTTGDNAAGTTLAVTVGTTPPANQPPVANAGGPYSGTVGTAVAFNGANSADPDGTIVSYAWDFGDGATGTGVSPSHAYTAAGTYTVTLTVTDDQGATGTANATASISGGQPNPLPPVANAGGPYSGNVGVAVQFIGSGSSDPDGTIASYAWDFGDGATAAVMSPTHAYAATGTYNVTLTVTDNDGLTDMAATTATIAAVTLDPPTANAGGPYSAAVGTSVQFDGSGSSDTDGTIVSYAWDFGDGSTGTGVNPAHAYAAAGAYNATLVVTDNDGLTGTANVGVQIFSGATPSIMKFRVPGKVELEKGETERKSIKVVGDIDGLASGEQLCGTVFLQKNGADYQQKSVCLKSGGYDDEDDNQVRFRYVFTAADAPAVQWTTYITLDGGAESQHITKTTKVKLEGDDGDHGDGDQNGGTPPSAGDPVLGQQTYDLNCAMCHGPGGTGGAQEAVVGESASEISSAIAHVPDMSFLSFLTATDVANLAAYLNQGQGTTPVPDTTAGQQAYDLNCVMCHGPGGTGGVQEAVVGESANDIASAIAHVPDMSFLAYLTSADIQAIAAYLGGGSTERRGSRD